MKHSLGCKQTPGTRVLTPLPEAMARMGFFLAVCLLAVPRPAGAVVELKRGQKAPPIELTSLDGETVDTTRLKGKILILVFGEIYHSRTRRATADIAEILSRESFREIDAMPVLIVAQKASASELKKMAEGKTLPSLILHDTQRQAFGAYQVSVLPSVVVVDKEGKVVHAIAAYSDRFPDVLADSLLLATGRLTAERFDQRIHPSSAESEDPQQVRAHRLTLLADQLTGRGLDDLAREKYAEALEAKPDYLAARLGLGLLDLKSHRMVEAQMQFEKVLEANPESLEATLGLAQIKIRRGGEELESAEELIRDVIRKRPRSARAHYLMGSIHERKGSFEQAAVSYKHAAEILLEKAES